MRKPILLAAALLVLTIPNAARAQMAFAPQLSWGSDSDFGVGARLVLGVPSVMSGFEVIGSADYFFVDCAGADCTWIEFNGNGAIPVKLSPSLNTYVGAGLNVTRVSVDVGDLGDSSDTEMGLNVLGGLKFPKGGLTPFVEGRFTISGADQFVITAGLLFGKR